MNEQQERFMRACESQWLVGGERYALSEDKEWTDLVCEVVGNQWIGGNIIKYAGEIRNSKRFGEKIIEVNFFKIAVYAYIWWLKEYRHPTTGVELKKEHWPSFMEKCWERERLLVGREITAEVFIQLVQWILKEEKSSPSREVLFFTIVARAYQWWRQEAGNFTDRDRGEEFEK